MTGIERMREFVAGIRPITVVCGVTTASYDREHMEVSGKSLRVFLADIADQIERETQPKRDPAAEDAEAIAWVREHGGLECVRQQIEIGDRVGRWLGERAAKTSPSGKQVFADEAMASLDRRLMPDGMEWPRFEDGEPVRVGDSAPFGTGDVMEVVGVEINRFGYVLHGSINDGMRECVDGDEHGVAVKRPDSWELLEEDVAGASCPDVYCENHHIDANDASYEWAMARDIVRRAKALAGDA